MTKLEEKYWELREEMDRAEDENDWDKYHATERLLFELCDAIVEEIMEEHSDVLKRLKNA